MKLETENVSVRFGIERAAYKANLKKQFVFLIGKYFGLKGKEERSKDRYCGLITDISCHENYDSFKGIWEYKLEIHYMNQKDENKTIAVVFEESGWYKKNRVLVYGEDPDSVKLELICTEK